VTQRQKEELRAFTSFARTCTLPLIEESETETAMLGTGTLFAVNGNHYLITAAHVIEGLVEAQQLDRIGIPLGRTNSAVSNLGRHFIAYVQWKDGDSGPFDAAIIRFDQPELVAALRKNWKFISPKNLGPIPERKQGFLVAGYPRQVSSRIDFALSGKFIAFATNVLPSPPEEREYRPGLDIFLKHDETGTALDGTLTELPRLQGMSGGSVWVARHDEGTDAVWSAESHLRLVGIQSAYVLGSYIRAKSWQLVAKLFDGLDSQAAKEIRAALDESYGTR
jgi:hypothetical protein